MHDVTQTVGRYRKQAADCIKTAQTTADPNAKLALIDMAQVWIILADEAEQNGGLVRRTTASDEERFPPDGVVGTASGGRLRPFRLFGQTTFGAGGPLSTRRGLTTTRREL